MTHQLRRLAKGILVSLILLAVYWEFLSSIWMVDYLRWIYVSYFGKYLFGTLYVVAVFLFLGTYIADFWLHLKNRK